MREKEAHGVFNSPGIGRLHFIIMLFMTVLLMSPGTSQNTLRALLYLILRADEKCVSIHSLQTKCLKFREAK